jgi:hypothetical protein
MLLKLVPPDKAYLSWLSAVGKLELTEIEKISVWQLGNSLKDGGL